MKIDMITGQAAIDRPDINKLRPKVRKAKVYHSTSPLRRRDRRDKKFRRVL